MAPESPNALDELDSPGRLDESGASGAARASGAPGSSAMEKGSGTLRSWGGLGAWTAYVLAVAAAAGFASVVSLAQGAVVAPGSEEAVATQTVGAAGAFALVALLCLLTGVFEEGVFRVLALDALGLACGSDSRGRVRAAFASAALFGLLHVSVGDVASASGVVSCAQLLLKPVQAGLFGLFMAAMYLRMRNLWTLAGVHAAFNLLSAGPLLLGGGVLQTYVTGSGSDLALLAVTTALLVPAAIAAVVRIR
ncbi:hypothetical protein B5F40_04310 [Gordonibacter sp. An230]|nr:hypothetical protein B5F40_04310 [Gordonibacter sp. An230]